MAAVLVSKLLFFLLNTAIFLNQYFTKQIEKVKKKIHTQLKKKQTFVGQRTTIKIK